MDGERNVLSGSGGLKCQSAVCQGVIVPIADGVSTRNSVVHRDRISGGFREADGNVYRGRAFIAAGRG
ncbi:hypothetical protein ES707_14605 [subsurface metagenome]